MIFIVSKLKHSLQVTAASEAVYGFHRRDGFIRTRAENRELMPIFNSKQDLEKLLM